MEFELEDVSMSIMGEQIFDLKEILEKIAFFSDKIMNDEKIIDKVINFKLTYKD